MCAAKLWYIGAATSNTKAKVGFVLQQNVSVLTILMYLIL
jgi:hypothetical protein